MRLIILSIGRFRLLHDDLAYLEAGRSLFGWPQVKPILLVRQL
jgi:hypothetical protein